MVFLWGNSMVPWRGELYVVSIGKLCGSSGGKLVPWRGELYGASMGKLCGVSMGKLYGTFEGGLCGEAL